MGIKNKNYILAAIFIAFIIGFWAYQKQKEKQLEKEFIKSRVTIEFKDEIDNYFKSSSTKYDLGDYQGAIEDYTHIISFNTDYSGMAYYYRGLSKDQLEDYRGAIEDYTKAIELDNVDASCYYYRGHSKLKINDKNGACLDFNKAEELGHSTAYESIRLNCY